MTDLNRRRFLQVTGAAGVAPMLPVLPARAAIIANGAKPAQLLWASLYGKAGSAPAFAALTGNMGLSSAASHRIYSKLAGTQAVALHGAARVTRVAQPAKTLPKGPPVAPRLAKPELTSPKIPKTGNQLVELVSEALGEAGEAEENELSSDTLCERRVPVADQTISSQDLTSPTPPKNAHSQNPEPQQRQGCRNWNSLDARER